MVVPLDPAAPEVALATTLDVARPRAIVAPGSSGLPPGLRVLTPPGPGAHRPTGPVPTPPDGGIFLCTSGTSGAPKGVLLGDRQLSHWRPA